MPGVTISAGYGAGGSVIAPRVAEELGLPLVDRAISSQVAERLHVTVAEAQGGAIRRSLAERFFGVLAPLAGGATGIDADGVSDAPLPADDTAQLREHFEAILRDRLTGGAVILGRAGAAALHDEPDVVTVRLFGPPAARAAQGARIEGVELDVAAARLPEVDAARAQYVKRLYGCDIDDPRLYDVQLDSTALSVETCVAIVVTAYRGLTGQSPSTRDR